MRVFGLSGCHDHSQMQDCPAELLLLLHRGFLNEAVDFSDWYNQLDWLRMNLFLFFVLLHRRRLGLEVRACCFLIFLIMLPSLFFMFNRFD